MSVRSGGLCADVAFCVHPPARLCVARMCGPVGLRVRVCLRLFVCVLRTRGRRSFFRLDSTLSTQTRRSVRVGLSATAPDAWRFTVCVVARLQ